MPHLPASALADVLGGPTPCGTAKAVPCRTVKKADGRARVADLAGQRGTVHRCPLGAVTGRLVACQYGSLSLGGPTFLYIDRSEKGTIWTFIVLFLARMGGAGGKLTRIGTVAFWLLFAARAKRQDQGPAVWARGGIDRAARRGGRGGHHRVTWRARLAEKGVAP